MKSEFTMVFVVGGINTDISGRPADDLLVHDSNIAKVTVSAGGVGRNIAASLCNLGIPTELLAPFGDDVLTTGLVRNCLESGIGLTYMSIIPNATGGVYLCVNDKEGDMYIAMNDMDICEFFTPEHINIRAINTGSACVLDANPPEETLLYIAQNARVPLICDPVSAAKCRRVLPILPMLFAIKPNMLEAQTLTGESDPEAAAKALVRMGVERAFVSLGAQGLCYADAHVCGFSKAHTQATVVNTTGAGDAATAAITIGCIRGMGIKETADFACETALHAIADYRNIAR